MAQTAAHRVDQVIARVPVRHWVLSFAIPLRMLLATQPQVLTPLLRTVHRLIARSPVERSGAKAQEAHTGAITSLSASARR